ncbi:MAG: site-specific integrase, partial [Verrucomicrobiota bacterium]
VVGILTRSYALGVEKFWLTSSPAAKLKSATAPAQKVDAVLTDEQFNAFITHLEKSAYPHKQDSIFLAQFLRFFGMRINAARNIKKSDVTIFKPAACTNSPVKGNVRMRKEFSKTGKEKPDQMFPITAETLPLIESLLARKDRIISGQSYRDDYLLPTGRSYKCFNRAFRALGFPASIKGHHHFRHLAATTWIENGLNFKMVAQFLSHCDGGKLASDVYSHVRTEAFENAVGKMSRGTTQAAPVASAFTPEQIAAAVAFLEAGKAKTVPMVAGSA